MLARLSFTDEELDRLTAELVQIIEYIDQLSELDTADTEPLAHAAELCNVFRADEPERGLSREAALGNAPNHDDQCFRVPAVLGD